VSAIGAGQAAIEDLRAAEVEPTPRERIGAAERAWQRHEAGDVPEDDEVKR
jgi:hypothetical protein